jgi:hypothetical protein
MVDSRVHRPKPEDPGQEQQQKRAGRSNINHLRHAPPPHALPNAVNNGPKVRRTRRPYSSWFLNHCTYFLPYTEADHFLQMAITTQSRWALCCSLRWLGAYAAAAFQRRKNCCSLRWPECICCGCLRAESTHEAASAEDGPPEDDAVATGPKHRGLIGSESRCLVQQIPLPGAAACDHVPHGVHDSLHGCPQVLPRLTDGRVVCLHLPPLAVLPVLRRD